MSPSTVRGNVTLFAIVGVIALAQACSFRSPFVGDFKHRDLYEAAGAADATACSRGGRFRVSKISSVSSGKMLLCQDFPLQRNSTAGMPQAIKWRNGH